MADAIKGGLGTSAFPASPASLATAQNAFRYRPKPGRTPQVEWIPVKASETIRRNDFLNRTATSAGFERILNPAGTATTATLTGDITDATAPLYIALANNTSSSSINALSKIPAIRVDDLQFLFRQYAAAGSDAEPQDALIGSWRYEPTSLYEWGIYEVDATSTNYFPIVDMANQDDDDGTVRIVEIAQESAIGDDFGLVWVEFEVSNLA